MCLYPRLIKNRKYTVNKKNGGNVPIPKDDRVKYVAVGCQNCIECRKQKSRQWQTRLLEDIKENKNAKFVTLTFSNEKYTELYTEEKKKSGYDKDNQIATTAVRRFLENWRKKHKKSVRHWLITELGQNNTEHIHIHGLIWTDNIKEIENNWKYGKTWVGDYVNERTINYIVKYVNKIDGKHKEYKSIILTSAGIGNNYIKTHNASLNKYIPNKTNEAYRTKTGTKIALPTYWRNRIYSEEQREELWLEKLDKQVRYVLGQKIDISKNDKEYNAKLKIAQNHNKRLGYGSDEKNWKQEQYEREQRLLKQKERLRMPPAG